MSSDQTALLQRDAEEEKLWEEEIDADDHLQVFANRSISSVGVLELLSENYFLLLPLSSLSQQLSLQKSGATHNTAITNHTQTHKHVS